jgi:hypothetical protein
MRCTRCGKRFAAWGRSGKCPHCGKPRPEGESGVFQTSAVLIAAQGADRVYRSMEEVPRPWRNKLLQSTNSSNSATILIADRRGREELARVMRNLPGSGGAAQRRAMRMKSLLAGTRSSPGPAWLSPRRKAALLAGLGFVAVGLIVLVFTRV